MTARDWIDLGVAIGTVTLAVATFVVAFYARQSAKESKDALGLLAEQTKALTREADAVQKQAAAAESALSHSAEQLKVAEAALEEARKQTTSAVAAVTETRHQRFVDAVPLLRVEQTRAGKNDGRGGAFASFKLLNQSDHPALHVRIRIFPMSDSMQTEANEVAHSLRIAVVDKDFKDDVDIGMQDAVRIPPVGGIDADAHFMFLSRWLRVTVEFRTLLGGRVVQHYDWFTLPDQKRWDLRKVEIAADPATPEMRYVVESEP